MHTIAALCCTAMRRADPTIQNSVFHSDVLAQPSLSLLLSAHKHEPRSMHTGRQPHCFAPLVLPPPLRTETGLASVDDMETSGDAALRRRRTGGLGLRGPSSSETS
uniref:Uncharacterized protein n=1 Tax=Craspedostauros australis TaxID=1486917 RepID=A0A7R9WTW6_9STRA|mmetsp:Transcript_17627/g.48949  ORF Transcript_17627/g.48949 Transcript_17627/m.48949 type:complete len:106 (+) Transcript_17627:166-483(+)